MYKLKLLIICAVTLLLPIEIFAQDSFDLSEVQTKFIGETAGDQLSFESVSVVGDVNNDGYNDVLVGAYADDTGGTDAGAAYLIYGPISSFGDFDLADADVKFIGENAGDYAGSSVAVSDVNQDGYDDILVGAYTDDTGGSNAGAAYLIYGSNSLASSIDLSLANVKFIGEEAEDNAGYFVSSAGDVNNDGYDDILIGAYADDTGGTNAGAAYLIYGSNSLASSIDLSLANVKFIGEEAEDAAGFTVSSAGDVNNDGFGDILIGAYLNDAGGTDAGAVYLSYLYIDVDGDGVAGTTGLLSGTDCNDSDATISENQTYYQDLDGDGIGNTDETTQACSYTAPDSYAANSGDCDDNEPGIYQEIVYYSDSDRDGLGDPNSIISVCSLIAPEGYVMNSDDEYPEYKDISSVESAEDGKVKITYVNNDVIYYQVFNISTNSKTKIIEYNFQYYLVLNSTGKKLALIDIHALSTLSKKTLSKKKKYSTNYLLSKEMRSKHFIVVVSKKGSKVLLSLVKLNLSKEIISLSDQQKINNKNISPQKTTVKDTSIKLKNKKSKVLLVYTVTKKYHLKEK